jgi:hypothetical protein
MHLVDGRRTGADRVVLGAFRCRWGEMWDFGNLARVDFERFAGFSVIPSSVIRNQEQGKSEIGTSTE